jgi:hypothetical protein
MFPHGPGGRITLEYDFQNQHTNWSRSSQAPGYQNPDKQIETHFVTLGFQYMVTADWGFRIEAPYEIRHFVTTGGASGTDQVSLHHNDLGDMRVKGIFDGFLDDHSLGVTFGFKLPTGNYTYNDKFNSVDRDTEIGTGSVDVLLGGFFHHEMWLGFNLFVQAELDLPVLDREQYHPGLEFDAAVGMYNKFAFNDTVSVSPLVQLLESARTSDTGKASANPVASGYERILLSPGLELDVGPVMVYGDAEVPVYMYMRGNQLVAPVLFKAMVGVSF